MQPTAHELAYCAIEGIRGEGTDRHDHPGRTESAGSRRRFPLSVTDRDRGPSCDPLAWIADHADDAIAQLGLVPEQVDEGVRFVVDTEDANRPA
jgi:hypothetical protein